MMTGCTGNSGQPAETTAAATEAVTEAPETTAAAEETTAAVEETTAAAAEATAAAAETTAAAEETTAAAAETTAVVETTAAAEGEEVTTAAADAEETTAAEGAETAAAESAAESKPSLTEGKTAVKKYTTGNLIIRSTASKDGERLAIVPIGVEIDVYEEGNEYVLIKYEDQEGYVYESYLTTDQEEAIQASKEYDAEQAAKAAAEKNSSSKKSSKKKKKSGGKKEVSRQKYDDCDGSGHGYYEITYSDGSKKIKKY